MPIHKSIKIAWCVGTLFLSVGVIGVSGSALAAVPTPLTPAHSLSGKPPATLARPAPEPPGYTVVTNNFSARNGSQSFGTADCPAGTVVWGGGAEIGTASLDANIGTSVPNGSGEWAVFVNNVSGADTDFNVYAICADQPSGYVIESNKVDDPAGRQSGAKASCPKRTVVLGGGGVSSSPYPSVNLNSSWPTVVKHIGSWNVDMNNASSLDASVGAYVVCGRTPGATRW